MGKEKKHKENKSDKREKYEELPVSRPSGLKLVLKVGSSPVPEPSEPRPETPPAVAPLRLNMAAISEAETQHKERRHKKKKKKEKEKHKHKKDRRQEGTLDADQEMSPGRESRQSSGTEEAPSQGTASPEPCRVISPPAVSADSGLEPPPLGRFLEHLLRGLQEKDTRGFFSVPVTDDVAPGYSSIIDTPMDFSTIANKIRDGQYTGLAAFKEDFRLMCCNAMTYNRMDTIYYRTAKRLLHIGSKMMSSDKVIALRSVLPYMAALSPEVLGVEASDLMDTEEQQQVQQQDERQQQQRQQEEQQRQQGQRQELQQEQELQEQQPVEEMEVDAELPAQPAEPVAAVDAPAPAPEAQPEPEPEQAPEPTPGLTETVPVPSAVDVPPGPSVAAARQTRRQTRGATETAELAPAEGRATRQTRAAEKPNPEPETPRQTRAGERPNPETPRQTRAGDRPDPETPRQTRAGERPDPETPRQTRAGEKPDLETPRQTRAGERPDLETPRQTRAGERPDPETPRQTRQARLVETKPEPVESKPTRQVREQEQSKPESEARQTRQGRATNSQTRDTEPQERVTEPQPRFIEPQLRATESQTRVTEPRTNAADHHLGAANAAVSEPRGGASLPAPVAPQLQPEDRPAVHGAVECHEIASNGPPPPPSGPAATQEPMDTSETEEHFTSYLKLKQPHLVLEKIDADPAMKLRSRASRPAGPPVPSGSRRPPLLPEVITTQYDTTQPPAAPLRPQRDRHQPETAAGPARAQSIEKPEPSRQLGFLRRRLDGTTSLAIVTGGERSGPVATVGGLTGRLQQGTPHLPTFRDDKRNQAKPVKPLYYGAYSSFAPSYDSTFATISHAESGLLFETLAGGQGGGQLANSVRQAADDCDIAIDMVDGLLDALTDGQHRRQEQRRRLADQALAAAPAPAPAPTAAAAAPLAAGDGVDFESLRSLEGLGIDVGFLDGFEAEERRSRDTQARLDQTSELISSLNSAQLRRLSLPPEAGLPPPSERELQLAEEVTGGLAELVKRARPGQVAPQAAVRKAMGVGPLPPGQELMLPAAAPAPATRAQPPPGTSAPQAHPSLRTLLSRV